MQPAGKDNAEGLGHEATWLARNVRLTFEGHADRRHSQAHNLKLSKMRATTLESYIDKAVAATGRTSAYSSKSNWYGEKFASRRYLAEDRRVDVFTTYVPPRQVTFEDDTVIGKKGSECIGYVLFQTRMGSRPGLTRARSNFSVVNNED